MEDLKKIKVLENELQARLLESVLRERGIPHVIRSYHDSAYDGLFQSVKGWGHVEAPASFREEILTIIRDLTPGSPAESDNREE